MFGYFERIARDYDGGGGGGGGGGGSNAQHHPVSSVDQIRTVFVAPQAVAVLPRYSRVVVGKRAFQLGQNDLKILLQLRNGCFNDGVASPVRPASEGSSGLKTKPSVANTTTAPDTLTRFAADVTPKFRTET